MSDPVTDEYAGAGGTATAAGGRSAATSNARDSRTLGHWIAGTLVTVLLLVASVPIASGVDRTSAIMAVLLSVGGGLSIRHPLVGTVSIGVILTLGIGHGPGHIGSGILASPVAIAACAARGHLLPALALAAWHLIPPTISSALRGDEAEFLVSQVLLWLVLETTAVLAGTAGRTLAERAGAERARRISDLAEQRRAIARELHDTGVRAMTQVVMLSENAGRRDGIEPPDAAQFSRIASTARGATEELRTLLETLRLEDAADTPLPAPATDEEAAERLALASLVESLRLRLATEGFTVQVSLEGDGSLPVARTGVLSRCLREIEANVIRHGDRCVQVAIMLELRPTGAGGPVTIDLVVRNGVAEEPVGGPRGGAGLDGMQERLAAVGGHLETRQEGHCFLTHLTTSCLLDAPEAA